MPNRNRPEEKPKERSKFVEPPKQGGVDAAQEKARAEFKKLFPKSGKTAAPPSRKTDK